MKLSVVLAALSLLVAPAARAADFDLGFAHPGMTLEQFRASAWPEGTVVRCSGEADLPPESDSVRLSLPRQVAELGGARCGLFHQQEGTWHPTPMAVAGIETEVWGKFFPDRAGTPRLMHLVLRQPATGFGPLTDYFTERFGPTELRRDNLAHWRGDGAEAMVIVDGGVLLAFLIDTRLQAALHARTSHHSRRTGSKGSQQ